MMYMHDVNDCRTPPPHTHTQLYGYKVFISQSCLFDFLSNYYYSIDVKTVSWIIINPKSIIGVCFILSGSGTIDLEEFRQLYNAMPMKPKGQSLKKLFEKYDTNGDGDLEIA